jgi:hypothetical protein
MSKKVKGTIARVLLGVAAMAFVVGGAIPDIIARRLDQG